MKTDRSRYPFQYFWDTCFHVYTITSPDDHQMAKWCQLSLFAMQMITNVISINKSETLYSAHRICIL
ncbi:hypothetical protein BH24BAC1_BH24BAC1_19470 [soil metagenome]